MIATSTPVPILVFAVGGRLGSGCSFVRDWLNNSLATYGYDVEVIDVSTVFLQQIGKFVGEEQQAEPKPCKADLKLSDAATRVWKLQRNGNELRKRLGNDIIAALCVNEVISPHIDERKVLEHGKRQAYII